MPEHKNCFKFERDLLESLKYDEAQVEYKDTEVPALRVIVNKHGKSFHAYCSRSGKRHYPKIGEVGVMSIKAARLEAARLASAYRATGHTGLTRSSDKPTLRWAMDLLDRVSATKGVTAKTLREYHRHVDLYLADLLDVPLAEITPDFLRDRHHGITHRLPLPRACRPKQHNRQGTTSPHAANDTIKAFRRAYNLAMAEDQSLPRNPADAVLPNPTRRKKAISAAPSDYARLWAAIDALPSPIRRTYYRVKLYTGLRGSDLRPARWEHVDLEQRTLTLPAPKAHRSEHVIPLPDQVMGFLADLPRTPDGWLFPSPRAKGGHIAEDKGSRPSSWCNFPDGLRA